MNGHNKLNSCRSNGQRLANMLMMSKNTAMYFFLENAMRKDDGITLSCCSAVRARTLSPFLRDIVTIIALR